jgi:site-specific recombinase XerD
MVKLRPVIRLQDDQVTKTGTYNLKILVTHKRKSRYIGTKLYLTKDQIDRSGIIINHQNAANLNIKVRNILNLYDQKILDLGNRIDYMDIQQIISFLKAVDIEGRDADLLFNMEKIIARLIKDNRRSYAVIMTTTKKHLTDYIKHDQLLFSEINPAWLEDYSSYLKTDGKSANSISIDLRNIRMVFNYAIRHKLIRRDCYPFVDYKIRSVGKTKKRSLEAGDIIKIRDAKLDKKNLARARDLFMLSFYLNGINFVDLVNARKEDVFKDRLIFKRAKTGRPYSIKIWPEAKKIIEWYKGEKYLLKFIEDKEQRRKKERSVVLYKDITDQTNRLLKKVAGKIELDAPLSTYFARHSLATIARNIGISRDDIRAILGHGQDTVTDIYIDLDQERIDDAMRKVLDEIK